MSTINIVKYYFYRGCIPKEEPTLKKMVDLAYQTAREKRLYPRTILIRSRIHDTKIKNGVVIQDPKGHHLTLAFKDADQETKKTHTACHGYVTEPDLWELVEATDRGEKPDYVKRFGGKPVWPEETKLDLAPDVAYNHLE